MNTVEVEIDGPRNQSAYFPPLDVTLRGRFDPTRIPTEGEGLGALVRAFPNGGIPGQRLVLDPATGTGTIVEPLADPANAKVRQAIEAFHKERNIAAGGLEFPIAARVHPGVHLPTWLGWLKRLVESGVARVVKGKLPEDDPPEMKKGFFNPPSRTDAKDEQIRQLTALLVAKLSPTERKEMAGILAGK